MRLPFPVSNISPLFPALASDGAAPEARGARVFAFCTHRPLGRCAGAVFHHEA